jgi:rhodanese-related sulfurtransferase
MHPFDVPQVSPAEVPADAVVLDVREPYEWAGGHIPGARHVPMNSVPATVDHQPETIPADERVYVVCHVGGRSAQVTAWLRRHGYDAVNIDGGMDAWQSAGRPVVLD